jgi:hypothetical protein
MVSLQSRCRPHWARVGRHQNAAAACRLRAGRAAVDVAATPPASGRDRDLEHAIPLNCE